MSELAPDPHEQIVQLSGELANIHRVHIDDIRALLAQFEIEKAQWAEKLQQAIGRECGALCNDIEQDRDELTHEVQKLREEGVPGVMHQADRLRLQVVEGDRDRFANLHANLVRRNRNLIGEFRAARHASRNVRLVEGLLADALGREPGSINGDNIEDAFADLVQEREHFRNQLHQLAAPGGPAAENGRIVETLRGRISLAVGTDLPRDRLVEMFDHLVSQYAGGERIVETLRQKLGQATGQDVARDQVVTTFDWLVQRAAEVAARTGKELRDAGQRADAAEEQVRRYADDASRRGTEVAQAHAGWAAEMTAERARYAGLESASQAVGQQLTQALSWCDRARARRVADTELLRTANGIICNAEDFKLTLRCLDSHCVERQHTSDLDNPMPIGEPGWKDAAQRWFIEFHAREAAAGAVPKPSEDLLVGFVVRVYSNGQHERVELVHESDTCRFSTVFAAVPSTDVALTRVIDDAYRHVLRAHRAEVQDEASPDDRKWPCETIGHVSQSGCCADKGRPPTEVNE